MKRELSLSKLKRIWFDESVHAVNVYAFLKRDFELSDFSDSAKLWIAADSDYIVYLDGKEIGRTQFSDDPCVKSFDLYELPALTAGKYELRVLLYYNGDNFSTYAAGLPGLYLQLTGENFELFSDETWQISLAPGFTCGEVPRVSPQLGFTCEFDARKTEFQWQAVKAYSLEDEERILQKRPKDSKTTLYDFLPGTIIKHGVMLRELHSGSTAKQMSNSQLMFHSQETASFPYTPILAKVDPNYGFVFILDLGGQQTGLLEFEIDAPEGMIIDIAHGEHLDDGRVRAALFGRNFADRYICRAGRQSFTFPFRRIAGRYLELHLCPSAQQSFTLYRCGVRPQMLSLPAAADFVCQDEVLLKLRSRAIKTLEMCMHEHYEDCPWREQALYTYDSRLQMLYGYYSWGNYDFAAASLNLWRHGQLEDGHLRLCAPSRTETVIPIYSLLWIIQIYEHWLYSADLSVFLENLDALAKMFRKLCSVRDSATGLLVPSSANYWHFYEWVPGLCENNWSTDQESANTLPDEVHSLYNLYMIEALGAYLKMCIAAGITPAEDYESIIDDLKVRVEKVFYNPDKLAYASKLCRGRLKDEYHEHTQVLMLYNNCVPEDKVAALLDGITQSKFIPFSLSALPYLPFTVFGKQKYNSELKQYTVKRIIETYTHMLTENTDTLWETAKGGDDFYFAGSLCHAWSSLPVYLSGGIILGVKPLDAGFKRFEVKPYHAGMTEAKGIIPTPEGNIEIQWEKRTNGKFDLYLKHPEKLKAEIVQTEEFKIEKIAIEEF